MRLHDGPILAGSFQKSRVSEEPDLSIRGHFKAIGAVDGAQGLYIAWEEDAAKAVPHISGGVLQIVRGRPRPVAAKAGVGRGVRHKLQEHAGDAAAQFGRAVCEGQNVRRDRSWSETALQYLPQKLPPVSARRPLHGERPNADQPLAWPKDIACAGTEGGMPGDGDDQVKLVRKAGERVEQLCCALDTIGRGLRSLLRRRRRLRDGDLWGGLLAGLQPQRRHPEQRASALPRRPQREVGRLPAGELH